MRHPFFLISAVLLACLPTEEGAPTASEPATSTEAADPDPGTSSDMPSSGETPVPTTSGMGTSAGCGDGVLDPAEECDDGNLEEGDSCSSSCKIPFCGDGLLHPTEECDTQVESASCDADCSFPVCGDGITNSKSGEQCDGEEGCSPSCTWDGTLVFVTSKLFSPVLGGTKGGDKICQILANTAGLGGTFRAWLWTSTGGPETQWPQLEAPFRLVNGDLLASSWEQFFGGPWERPIDITENGIPFGEEEIFWGSGAWTGLHPFSGPNPDSTCLDWTSTQAVGGLTLLDSLFWGGLEYSLGHGCYDQEHRLICVQTPDLEE